MNKENTIFYINKTNLINSDDKDLLIIAKSKSLLPIIATEIINQNLCALKDLFLEGKLMSLRSIEETNIEEFHCIYFDNVYILAPFNNE